MDTIIGLLFILGFAFMLIYGTSLNIQDILHDNKRCNHNIRGGATRKLCEICVNQAYEELQRAKLQKQKEEQEKQRKLQIIIQAGTLQRHEIERLKKIQLQKKDYIRSLSPQQFENVVADIFSKLGYIVKQTPYSNDGGRDAILTKDGKTYLLECKLYSPDNTIGRRDLQIFFAAMQGDKAGKGFYVNTGRFASTAKEYAKANNIELIGIDKLVEMMGEVFPNTNNENISMSVMCIECGDIVKFSLEKSETEKSCTNKHNINLLTQKEYCDKCGKEMNEINGPYSKFWGCMGYPTCKNTKPYVSKAKLLDSFARKEQSNNLLTPNESKKPIVINAGEGNENLFNLLKQGYKVTSVEMPQEKGQDASYYSNRGTEKYNLKDYTGAVEDCIKAIELDHNFTSAYFIRGMAKSWLGDYTEAIADFTKVIELDSKWEYCTYSNRGTAKYNLEDYKGAIEDYTKAIELNPNNYSYYKNRASIKYDSRDYIGALADYTKTLELSPESLTEWEKSRTNELREKVNQYN